MEEKILLPACEELALALDEHRAGLLEEREEDGDVGAVEAEDDLLVEGVEARVVEEGGEERAVLELAERVDVLAELVELLLRRDALLAADVHVLGVRDPPARREVARDEAADEVLVAAQVDAADPPRDEGELGQALGPEGGGEPPERRVGAVVEDAVRPDEEEVADDLADEHVAAQPLARARVEPPQDVAQAHRAPDDPQVLLAHLGPRLDDGLREDAEALL